MRRRRMRKMVRRGHRVKRINKVHLSRGGFRL